MALSFRSNSFLSLREQMDSLNSQGLLNTENAKELIEKNGLSVGVTGVIEIMILMILYKQL